LNAAENPKNQHVAYIGLGSNIEPETNMVRALSALRQDTNVLCTSSAWRAPALGIIAPDFLNAVVKVETPLSASNLKEQVLRPIETKFRRRRSRNKNAPRTIDLDILIFNDEVLDAHIWDYAHLTVPLAECYPTLINPSGKQSIEAIAKELRKSNRIEQTELFNRITS
jgi:2-amino-4-hydroxy-6-hydroxymethyldihydropteridine diphosphokinase